MKTRVMKGLAKSQAITIESGNDYDNVINYGNILTIYFNHITLLH